jgi:hypothetical protein
MLLASLSLCFLALLLPSMFVFFALAVLGFVVCLLLLTMENIKKIARASVADVSPEVTDPTTH